MTITAPSPATVPARFYGDATSERWQDVVRDGPRHPEFARSRTAQGLVAHAVALALGGDSVRARHLAAQAAAEAPMDSAVAIGASLARAIGWIGEGDYSAAYETLAYQFGTHRHTAAARYLIDLTGFFAEAAVRVQQTVAARSVLAQWSPLFEEAPAGTRFEFELASAILYDVEPGESIVNSSADGSVRPTLTTARLHLALGMSLRRHRRTRESRPHLMIAADLLAECGATPWLTIAASELRAAGVRQDAEGDGVTLSPQERTIAELAAQGLSNREIGERLYLSPRTVGSHLYRIFPKLGITSRHQLRG